MARIFEYGKLNRVASKQGNFLPGMFTDAQGVYYGKAAIGVTTEDYKFGEIVEIKGETNKALQVARADANTANFGFVIRDVVGQRVVEAGMIEGVEANSNLPFTVLPASAPQGWGFVVAVGKEVQKGAAIGMGKGTGSGAAKRNLGVAYEKGEDTNVAAITGWVFASDSFKPTSGDGLCAFVKKV